MTGVGMRRRGGRQRGGQGPGARTRDRRRSRARHDAVGPLTLSAVLVLAVLSIAMTSAQEAPSTTIVLDGRATGELDRNAPLRLDADEPLDVAISVRNVTDEDLVVRSARLKSNVIGLTFLAYETRIDLQVPASGTAELAFQLDLLDLRQQATGLLPADVELLDADRQVIASDAITVDVQGSLTSVYGLFGAIIIAITLIAAALVIVRLATGRLPDNRWARALQFAAPGIGLGLVATIGLSTLRVFSPEPAVWAALLLGLGGAGFAAGYLTPAPARGEVVDLADIDVMTGDTGGVPPAPAIDSSSASTIETADADAARRTIAGQGPPPDPDR